MRVWGWGGLLDVGEEPEGMKAAEVRVGGVGGRGRRWMEGPGLGAVAARAVARVTVTDGARPGGSFIKRRIRGPGSHLRAEIEF